MESPNLILAKKLNRLAWVATAAVLILVALMREVKIPVPEGVDFAPPPPGHTRFNLSGGYQMNVHKQRDC